MTTDEIIQKIASLQDSANQKYFPEGIFEAYRSNDFWHYRRPDTNVFFTAITVFTLNNIKEKISPKSQSLVEEITTKAQKAYPLFKNKDGLNTYNFFQTNPSQHFPHGNILNRFNYFKIPDDIDDTAMIYLTTSQSQKEANWLKDKLIQHSNLSKKQIQNTFPEYRNLKAYSTWFGKNMYIEFDVCAISNMLYCLLSYDVELDEHGQDSVKYIQQTILSNQYIEQPFRVAHQYARTPLIMYHVARLMGKFMIPTLEICREQLMNDILYFLQNDTLHPMDKIILETSLWRLDPKKGRDLKPRPTNVPLNDIDFSFFIAGFLTAYQNPLLYRLASSPLFHIQWTCEAHQLALIAEWMVVTNAES
jgi:hypothetical protein